MKGFPRLQRMHEIRIVEVNAQPIEAFSAARILDNNLVSPPEILPSVLVEEMNESLAERAATDAQSATVSDFFG